MIDQILKYIGAITVLVIVVYVFVRLFVRPSFLSKVVLGGRLKKSISAFVEEWPGKVTNETVTELLTALLKRITRVFTIPLLISLLVAAIPFILLRQQNRLIEEQNKLFSFQNQRIDTQTILDSTQTELLNLQTLLLEAQNDKLDNQLLLLREQNNLFGYQNKRIQEQVGLLNQQNHNIYLQNNLLEAERRGSLVFLMNNILDNVGQEINAQERVGVNKKYKLSLPLVNRIIALSRAFRPYRILEGDSLSQILVSPERGQLFISLMNSQLDSSTQAVIVESGDFSHAVIGKVRLDRIVLDKVNLSHANLSGADFTNSSIIEANFQYADFQPPPRTPPYTYRIDEPGGSNFEGSVFLLTHFENAVLRSSGFRKADISMSLFTNADLEGSFFDGARLDFVWFDQANLSKSSFKNTILEDVVFREADISGVDFSGAEFRYRPITFNGKQHSYMPRFNQLIQVRSLYESKNIPGKLMDSLMIAKPCLFTSSGCSD